MNFGSNHLKSVAIQFPAYHVLLPFTGQVAMMELWGPGNVGQHGILSTSYGSLATLIFLYSHPGQDD